MDGIKLLVSDHHGVYVPKVFAENFDIKEWNVSDKEAAYLVEGPDQEWYWEAWESVLSEANYKDENGNLWHLYQDGDLWAYCSELMSDEQYEEFFGESREV